MVPEVASSRRAGGPRALSPPRGARSPTTQAGNTSPPRRLREPTAGTAAAAGARGGPRNAAAQAASRANRNGQQAAGGPGRSNNSTPQPAGYRAVRNARGDAAPAPYAYQQVSDDLLKKLLSGPKAPNWARSGSTTSGSFCMPQSGDRRNSIDSVGTMSFRRSLLGKWAHGSQVGSRVCSTSDLFIQNATVLDETQQTLVQNSGVNTSSSSSLGRGRPLADVRLGMSSISTTASGAPTTTKEVKRSLSDSRRPYQHPVLDACSSIFGTPSVSVFPTPTGSERSIFGYSSDTTRERSRPTWRSCSPVSRGGAYRSDLSSAPLLRPLPPKPCFPPPQNGGAVSSQDSPKQLVPKSACVVEPPFAEQVDLSVPAKAIISPIATLREIPTPCRSARKMAPPPVNMPKSEEVPHPRFESRADFRTSPMPHNQATAQKLRQDVQRLCSDVANVLGPGPGAAQVNVLLSNIDAILVDPSGNVA